MEPLLARGIDLFNRREFFLCHEVLEELWTPERGPNRLFLQAVIHVAVACYHCQRANWRGAEGQFTKALRKLHPYLPAWEGVDTARLHRDASRLLRLVQSHQPIDEFPAIALL